MADAYIKIGWENEPSKKTSMSAGNLGHMDDGIEENRILINQLEERIADMNGTGLSTEVIDKLDEIGNHIPFTSATGGALWDELIALLRSSSSEDDTGGDSGETEVALSSISVTYTGGNVTVGTALTDLTGITVTATYSDNSTANVTGYTLSGSIAEGSNTIIVSYGGKTTTFTVIGVAESGGEETDSEELMNDSNIVATGYAIEKNAQYKFYQLTAKEGANIYEIPVEAGETYALSITNQNQYGTPYWSGNALSNLSANTDCAISAEKFTDFISTTRVTVTLDGNSTVDNNMTVTSNGDGTYTRTVTFIPAISGYFYVDNRTSVGSTNVYSVKKVVK